jgi:hypothetical protein
MVPPIPPHRPANAQSARPAPVNNLLTERTVRGLTGHLAVIDWALRRCAPRCARFSLDRLALCSMASGPGSQPSGVTLAWAALAMTLAVAAVPLARTVPAARSR